MFVALHYQRIYILMVAVYVNSYSACMIIRYPDMIIRYPDMFLGLHYTGLKVINGVCYVN